MYRLIFLGAGFSKPAGLPLGSDLFNDIRNLIRNNYGPDSIFEYDLNRYIQYIKKCENQNIVIDQINYEDFLNFLDFEHYLGLKGKDTWSSEGNESQLMVRNAIGKILYQRTPKTPPDLYKKFVKQLSSTDWIFTFNYDTLLENTLESEGIPYRLYPYRYSKINWDDSAIVDNTYNELVVIKLHGSIDWFDKRTYDERLIYSKKCPIPYIPQHSIFGPNRIVNPLPIVEGPRPISDSLNSIFKVKDISNLVNKNFLEYCPLILNPSSTKYLYFQPLKEFWWGLQQAGGLNLSICIVGYSLPYYDKYVRQLFYNIFTSFTNYEPDLKLAGQQKTKIKILDFSSDKRAKIKFKKQYQFAVKDKVEYCFEGLNENSIDWLF